MADWRGMPYLGGAARHVTPNPPSMVIPLDLTMQPGDLEECLIGVKSTAPGENQVTTAVTKSVWAYFVLTGAY